MASDKRHFLLSGRRVEMQVGHNDFRHEKDKRRGSYETVTGPEGAFLYPCEGSHYFVLYSYDVKERLASALRMEEVTISSN